MDYDALHEIREALASGDEARLRERLTEMRPADLADVVERLDDAERAAVFGILDDEAAGDLLQEMDEADAAQVVRALAPDRASRLLEEMPPDDAVDVLQDLPEEAADAILAGMDAEEAADVRELLEHPENSAGGRMSTDFVTISAGRLVSEVIAGLRENPPSPEMAYYLYVVDGSGRLAGVVSLRDLVVAAPDARVAEIMTRDVVRVHAAADQEEAANLVAHYDLLAVPVVDDEERVVGVVTVDDVLEVLEEEATEDILHLSSGVETPPESAGPAPNLRLRRAAAALGAGLAAALVVSAYRQAFHVRVAYFLFVPLALAVSEVITAQVMAAIGGAIRRDASSNRLARAVAREIAITAVVAAAAGGLVTVLLGYWQGMAQTGIALGVAVFLVAMVAALVGGLLPVLSRAVRRDPTVVSVSVAAAIADTAALGVYFWVVVVLG